TSSPAATRPVTTATSGPRCCPPTPSRASRRKACSTRKPAAPSATPSWRAAAPRRRCSCSWIFVAASRPSTRCCATAAWRRKRHERGEEALHRRRRMPRLRGDGHHQDVGRRRDRKSTRLNSSHVKISYAVFCLIKRNKHHHHRKNN